ncbi:VOC family protein [Evansella tamaricis]|uniref:VOC family protein n=1 Tax=Evansella tamaricis TaxID=2069301 RepID=A0ABS6JAL6_9BACI|nr:VOC family protein [Evansella tamaricis]MBU9710717.1 VOC family protein [Evansella tamaricis]
MEKKFFQKPNIYVGQVNINVMDLEKSLQFYRDFIGFKVLSTNEQKVTLTVDGKHPLLTLESPRDVLPKNERATGLYHFAILLPGRTDLSAFLRHVIQENYPIGASDHLVSEAIYLSDPDGNGIEVYRDRLEEEWNWRSEEVSMATEPLDGQGILAETDKLWEGLPKGAIIGHIHLHVSELKSTEEFYVKGLGFDVMTRRYPGALFLSTGGYHHHIGLNIWNGMGAPAPEKKSVGMNWFSLEFSDTLSREKTVRQLENIGASIQSRGNQILTKDPSGNQIVLKVTEK